MEMKKILNNVNNILCISETSWLYMHFIKLLASTSQ